MELYPYKTGPRLSSPADLSMAALMTLLMAAVGLLLGLGEMALKEGMVLLIVLAAVTLWRWMSAILEVEVTSLGLRVQFLLQGEEIIPWPAIQGVQLHFWRMAVLGISYGSPLRHIHFMVAPFFMENHADVEGFMQAVAQAAGLQQRGQAWGYPRYVRH